MNNFFVLTGAPGAGKTAVLNILEERGYYCEQEGARANVFPPWKDIYRTDSERKQNWNEVLQSRLVLYTAKNGKSSVNANHSPGYKLRIVSQQPNQCAF